jgi:hypothetical protein
MWKSYIKVRGRRSEASRDCVVLQDHFENLLKGETQRASRSGAVDLQRVDDETFVVDSETRVRSAFLTVCECIAERPAMYRISCGR